MGSRKTRAQVLIQQLLAEAYLGFGGLSVLARDLEITTVSLANWRRGKQPQCRMMLKLEALAEEKGVAVQSH